MKNKFQSIFALSLFSMISAYAQNGYLGIGTTTPHISAALDLTSTSKGFLPPRMTYDQKTAISLPAAGLIVWCTDCTPKGLYILVATSWSALSVSADSSVSGGASTIGDFGLFKET